MEKFAYLLLGLGVGTAAGMLFAPKSGTESRNYIRDKAQESTDYVKRQGQQLRDTATQTIEQGKQTIQSQIKNLADAMGNGAESERRETTRV